MKVLLLYTDRHYLVNQVYPLGLGLIANSLRGWGHEVEIEYPFLPDMDMNKNVEVAMERMKPDFVGIGIRNLDTCMSCEPYGDFKGENYQTFFFLPQIEDTVDQVRRVIPHVPIVVGGGAFTVSPAAILKHLGLKYGIVGEGEEPFRRFIEAFPDKEKISKIPNMVYPDSNGYRVNGRQSYVFDQNPSRFRREPKFNFSSQTNGVPVVVKRGCNQACSYCVEPLIEGNKFSFRPIDDILCELLTMASGPEEVNNVFFVDTEFNVPDSNYGSKLVRAISEAGLNQRFRFISQFIPRPFDLDFAKILAEAGFSVVFSCESFSNAVLERNGISYREADIIEAIEACEQMGMYCTVALIFGLPGETYETIDYTLNRMKEYPLSPLRSYEYTVGARVYDGTPLCRYVEKHGPAENLFGTASEGYLLPYYYCAPTNPFAVDEYVKGAFPYLTSHENKYDRAAHEHLAIAYLSDQGRWNLAVERFISSDVSSQKRIFDYLFRRLVGADRKDEARTISFRLLESISHGELADPGQAEMVRFYLSCLG